MVFCRNQVIPGRKPKHKTHKSKKLKIEKTMLNEENELKGVSTASAVAAIVEVKAPKNCHNFFSSRIFKCYECEATFTRSFHFRKHLDAHENKGPFVCSKCRTAFSLRSSLTSHMEDHERKQRFFDCKICGNSFKTLYFLKKHNKTHDASHFVCDSCGANFREKSVLKKHVQECVKLSDEPTKTEEINDRVIDDLPDKDMQLPLIDNVEAKREDVEVQCESLMDTVTAPFQSSPDTSSNVSLKRVKPCSVLLERLPESKLSKIYKSSVVALVPIDIKPCYVKLNDVSKNINGIMQVVDGKKNATEDEDAATRTTQLPTMATKSTICTEVITSPANDSGKECFITTKSSRAWTNSEQHLAAAHTIIDANLPEQNSSNDHQNSSNDHQNSSNDHRNSSNDHRNSSNDHRNSSNGHRNSSNGHRNTSNDHRNTSNDHQNTSNGIPSSDIIYSGRRDSPSFSSKSNVSLNNKHTTVVPSKDNTTHLNDITSVKSYRSDTVLPPNLESSVNDPNRDTDVGFEDTTNDLGIPISNQENCSSTSVTVEYEKSETLEDACSLSEDGVLATSNHVAASGSSDLPSTSASACQQDVPGKEIRQLRPSLRLPSHCDSTHSLPNYENHDNPISASTSENKRALLLAWLQWTELQKKQISNPYF